eukprot:5759459-Pleurochrysis_carterae.AAC.1
MRMRASRQARYSGKRSAAKWGASAASIRSRKRVRSASLNRCEMLLAGWVPKPRPRSETKKSALPVSSATRGGVRRSSSSRRTTMPSFHHSWSHGELVEVVNRVVAED